MNDQYEVGTLEDANRFGIQRMAREAGLDHYLTVRDFPKQLERFASLVAAHESEKWKAENKRDYENWKMAAEKAAECEREACAKVCETDELCCKCGDECAAAIRARRNKND